MLRFDPLRLEVFEVAARTLNFTPVRYPGLATLDDHAVQVRPLLEYALGDHAGHVGHGRLRQQCLGFPEEGGRPRADRVAVDPALAA